jgi:NADH:ubiquinone reductase (H+-translocating)
MTDHSSPTRVVVLGGGYAGTLAANHLRMRADVDVTVVNPRPQFVERIRLHQFAAGTGSATVDYGTLLGKGVQLVVDSAIRIDIAARTVLLASGNLVAYDYAIYAVGSSGVTPAVVPGAVDHAYPIAELEQAQRLRAVVEDLQPGAPIIVVGAGLTGIETAAELAERGGRVTLVCGGTLAPSLSEPGRRSIAMWLTRNAVRVVNDSVVTEVLPDAVVLGDGTVLASAVTVWATGFGVPDLAARSGLRTDPLGRLLTDETLTSVDDDRVVGAGDAAAPSGQPLRMSCQAAGPLGVQAADTVLSRIGGTEPAVVDQAFVASCISLGRRAGMFQLTRKDDTPLNVFIGGRMGASIKETVCRKTVWSIRREARKPGSFIWRKGGRRSGQPVPAAQPATNP